MPGTRLIGGGGAGQHEDAGPDDRADPEQRQVDRGQRAPQRLAAVLGVADELLDRLRLEEIRIHSPSGDSGLASRSSRHGRVRLAADVCRSPNAMAGSLRVNESEGWQKSRHYTLSATRFEARRPRTVYRSEPRHELARPRSPDPRPSADRRSPRPRSRRPRRRASTRSSVMPPIATTGFPRPAA